MINLINGLFGTKYPLDSKVEYNWTEFTSEEMKRILADTIIMINRRYSYHMEAQIERDDTIVFRVFEYGLGHAVRHQDTQEEGYVIHFPRPAVIYLYYEGNVPDEYILTLSFEEGMSTHEYRVPVLKLPDISAKELNDRKMVILIPFHLLKLRRMLKEKPVSECLNELKSLIEDDILGSIEANHKAGNITTEDAYKLRSYTQKLWEYLRKNYKELEVLKDMTDESFMTDIDLLCAEYEKKIEKYEQKIMEGEARGNDLKLLSQICRKLQKGKTIDVIAEELEEEEDYIEHICQIAAQYAPEYDVEKIYEELHAVSV